MLLVVCILGTSVGWQHSFSQDMVEELNELGWPDKDCVFYESDGKIVAQTPDEKVLLSKQGVTKSFDTQSFNEKKEIIADAVVNMEKVDVETVSEKKEALGYSPGFTSELGYYYLNLYNGQGQGRYDLCWAATVATIVNYLQGKNQTAKNVADKIGIGYVAATDEQMRAALKKYGVSYVYRNVQLYFSTVMENIQMLKPIGIMGAPTTGNIGHAVTLYGYRKLADGNYIMIWDSNGNDGTGGMFVTSYNPNGTTFVSAGASYTWNRSLSYK